MRFALWRISVTSKNDFCISSDERLDYVNEKITLIQKKNGLTFGTDAFLLAAFIKENKRARAAELGCGTGIISLLCAAREKLSKIYAFEVQESFFDITKRNVDYNGFEDKVIPLLADIRNVNSSNTNGELDVVFANPPYMKTTSGKRNEADEKFIARHEVMGTINDFCSCASKLLKHGGKFYAVWRPDRLIDLIASMRAHKLEPKIMTFVHSDTESEPSMVLVCAVKGGNPSIKVTAPLILHENYSQNSKSRPLSAKAQKIYDTLNFEHNER